MSAGRPRRRIGQRLAISGRAFVAVARAAHLRRALLSFGAAWTAEWAFTVALGVVAFRQAGAAAVGLVAFARMAPSALVAPLASTLADRFRREHVLILSSLVRGVAIAAATLVLALGGPSAAVYALAVVATAAFVVFRPAHSALLPALCGSPLELTSANLVRGLLDSLSTLLGPLVATVLLAFASPVAAFGATAWLALVAGVLLLRMPYEAPPAAPSVALPRTVRDIGAGFRGLWSSRDVRLLIGLALVQTFTRGCLNVFLVAIPLELFHTGAPGVGLITATVGIGAIAGSLGALALTGGRRLAAIEGAGVALWGLPLTLCGVMANQPAVLALFALIGVGNALVDVGLFTLPARLVPYELLARIFGAFESLVAVTVALGSLITPFVIGALGIRGALVVLGLPAPVLVALAWRRLHAIDGSLVHRDREVAVLRSVGVLAPLPMPTIDSLALHAASMEVAAGQEVFHQGDAGDSFYVIKAGEADVVGDGRLVRTLGAGDCFGEIALLRDTPRTASVRARTTLSLLSLSRPEFILAVGGFSASTREVDGLLRTRLTAFDPARSG